VRTAKGIGLLGALPLGESMGREDQQQQQEAGPFHEADSTLD
jgi:hypothetical protein